MLIFDIGANVGEWAKANSNDSTKIISVEASPITFEKLKSNVIDNKNIIPLNYAVHPTDSSHVSFFHSHRAHTLSTLNKDWLTSSSSRFESYKDSIEEMTVSTISIDRLIDIYGLPDLIKIDVEGAEHIVVKALTKKVPVLCFEWASEWILQNEEVINYLVSIGFSKFTVQYEDSYKYRPDSYPLTSQQAVEVLKQTTPKLEWGMVWAM